MLRIENQMNNLLPNPAAVLKRSFLLTLLFWFTLGCGSAAYGQFHYFGTDFQIIGGRNGTTQFATGIGWLHQFSTHHGFGADLVLPRLLFANPGKYVDFSENNPAYDCGLIWTRKSLPAIAARYRLFIGNEFFIGTNLQFGMIHERFFADRMGNYSGGMAPIEPVFMDFNLFSPYFRLSFETGFVFDIGGKLYGTVNARIGAQKTMARVPAFGSFSLDYDEREEFRPITGTNVMGGVVLGLGLKL